ncbi:hypothetical protein Hamer_G029010, partial [Homarus americanus]
MGICQPVVCIMSSEWLGTTNEALNQESSLELHFSDPSYDGSLARYLLWMMEASGSTARWIEVVLNWTRQRKDFEWFSVLPSLLHLTVRPSLTPTPHSESVPHPYTSQGVLPSLQHLSESFPHSYTSVTPSLTPKHQRDSLPHSYTSHESFPHSYTSQRVLPTLLHITVSPSLTPTYHSEPFPHSYTS